MLKPKLKATLSTPPKLPLLGNRAAIKVYPGKKRRKGKLTAMRKDPVVNIARGTSARLVAKIATKSTFYLLLSNLFE